MDWSAAHVSALRRALRLSQEDFAEHVGAAARTVRSWESGQNSPGLALQRALDGALRSASDEQRDRFAARMERDAHQRGAGHHLGGSGGMDRQDFLRALLAAGGTVVLDGPLMRLSPQEQPKRGWGPLARRPRGADPRVVADYAAVTAAHRHLYWSLAPADIIGPATAHAGLGLDLLGGTTGATREELAVFVTEALLLVGRVEFFDLRRTGRAQSYLSAAAECAQETDQVGLIAAVTAHRSFLPAFAGRDGEAIDVVDHAIVQAAHGVSATTRSWLYAVTAEVCARAHNEQGTLRALGRAEGALEGADIEDDPEWMDFFDQARLDGFKGYAYLSVRRPAEAREALTRTLNALPDHAQKQRAVTLADLAAADLQQGDIEAATQLARAALQVTVEEGYATAAERLLAFRLALGPFGRHSAVVEFDERLRLAKIG